MISHPGRLRIHIRISINEYRHTNFTFRRRGEYSEYVRKSSFAQRRRIFDMTYLFVNRHSTSRQIFVIYSGVVICPATNIRYMFVSHHSHTRRMFGTSCLFVAGHHSSTVRICRHQDNGTVDDTDITDEPSPTGDAPPTEEEVRAR